MAAAPEEPVAVVAADPAGLAAAAVPGPALLPVPTAAARAQAAREERERRVAALRGEAADLRRQQRDLRVRLKRENKEHARDTKKLRTIPTRTILQHLRERGMDV
jgi:hypothetical protein